MRLQRGESERGRAKNPGIIPCPTAWKLSQLLPPTQCHAHALIRSAMHENHYHFSFPRNCNSPCCTDDRRGRGRQRERNYLFRPTYFLAFRSSASAMQRNAPPLPLQLCQIVSPPLLRKQNASLIIPRSVRVRTRMFARSVGCCRHFLLACTSAPPRHHRRQQQARAWHTKRVRREGEGRQEGREGGRPTGKNPSNFPMPASSLAHFRSPPSPRSQFSFPSLRPLSSSSFLAGCHANSFATFSTTAIPLPPHVAACSNTGGLARRLSYWQMAGNVYLV